MDKAKKKTPIQQKLYIGGIISCISFEALISDVFYLFFWYVFYLLLFFFNFMGFGKENYILSETSFMYKIKVIFF